MTSKKHYKNQAILETFIKLFDSNTLAEQLVEIESEFTIDKVRDFGIIIKTKKEMTIDHVREILEKAFKQVIKSDKDDFEDKINDKFEIKFEMNDIDDSFICEMFSVKIDKKKYIYIEIEK